MGVHRKSAAIHAGLGDGTPDAAALAAINAYTLRDLAAEEVYAREAIIAHNGIDRDREAISDGLLDAFAASLPGKGFFVSHPGGWNGAGGPGEGRWFRAHTERMSLEQARAELGRPDLRWPDGVTTATVLKGSFYLPRATAAELVERIDAGVARDISIQFTAKAAADHRDEDGRLIWRQLDAPGEALEASLVWLGAQPGARVTKAAHTDPDPDPEDTGMTDEIKRKLAAAEAERDTARTEATAAKATATTYEALRKALGDDAAVLDDPAAAAGLIRAGKQHRASLIDAIVTAERTAGLLGDDEQAVNGAQETYALLPTDKLEALAKRYAGLAASTPGANSGTGDYASSKSALAGGDPNAGAPGTRAKAATGYLANPGITGAA